MNDKEALLRAARHAVAEYLRLCKKRPTSCLITRAGDNALLGAKVVKFDDVLVYLSELIEEEAKRSEAYEREQKDTVPFDFDMFNAGLMDIPKGMTNGDVVKAMFPNVHPGVHADNTVMIYSQGADKFFNKCQFDEKWWNAPYKRDKE